MRGYFGVGIERSSKPMNAGNLFRTAHAFGAHFVFTIAATYAAKTVASDTSHVGEQIPWYEYQTPADFAPPKGCQLVGVELTDDALDLGGFPHPLNAAYVLGPEKGSLSPELQARCAHIVKIPTRFCLNVATAGAVVLYDRYLVHGRAGPRALFQAPRA